jgi:predicted nicotinamide N-methyase
MKSSRFSIELNSNPSVFIQVNEILDISYGCYVWPSSIVLASYLILNKHLFINKRVIELGCGVCIPGMFALKLGAAHVW